ncbi:hypothetical protein ACWNX2_00580 [Candidatus Vidania fulgoroideorum]
MNQLIQLPNIHITKTALPESKSIVIRVLFITAFLNKPIVIKHINLNEDIKVMLSTLRRLGHQITYIPPYLTINTTHKQQITTHTLHLKNSGITARLMCVFALFWVLKT